MIRSTTATKGGAAFFRTRARTASENATEAQAARHRIELARADGRNPRWGTGYNDTYRDALHESVERINESDVGIRSALKQAASDRGIPYGKPMAAFVAWAERQMGI